MEEEIDTPAEEWSAIGVLGGGAILWLVLVLAVGSGLLTILFWISLVPIVLGALGFAVFQMVRQLREDGRVPGRFARAIVCVAFAFSYAIASLWSLSSVRFG